MRRGALAVELAGAGGAGAGQGTEVPWVGREAMGVVTISPLGSAPALGSTDCGEAVEAGAVVSAAV